MRRGALVPLSYVPPDETPRAVVTLDEVEEFRGERVDTGVPGVNRVLGRNRADGKTGLHLPSCVIFGGGQGCGKTTLMMTVLAKVREPRTLFLTSEQTLAEVKSTLVGIGLQAYAGRIQAHSLLDEGCDLAAAMAKVAAVRPRVLVVDSVSKLRDAAHDTPDANANQARLVEAFKRDAEVHHRATVLVSHLNKEDEVRGNRTAQYDVSAVMILAKHDKTRRRLHCPDKNRFGNIAEEAWFAMGERGMTEIPTPDLDEERREERREQRRAGRED
jgi:DNA repair protein RadA/Sms